MRIIIDTLSLEVHSKSIGFSRFSLVQFFLLTKQKKVHPTREIPLYDVDGKTVIGKFIVGGGTVKEFKTPAEAQKFEKGHQIAPN